MIPYDSSNSDLMWKSIEFTPDGSKVDDMLNIMLEHQISKVKTTIKSHYAMTFVDNAVFGPNYRRSKFSLSNGSIVEYSSEPAGRSVVFTLSSSDKEATAVPIIINASEGLAFSADVKLNGKLQSIKTEKNFILGPKSDIDLKECGAYTAPGVWKKFSCYNVYYLHHGCRSIYPVSGYSGGDVEVRASWR